MKISTETEKKLKSFEGQIKNLQEQMEAVQKAISDLTTLQVGIDELSGKNGEEILAPIGRGIFVPAKITSENLLVDIGNGNLVKKNISETQKILKFQGNKLNKIREELESAAENLNSELERIVQEGLEKKD